MAGATAPPGYVDPTEFPRITGFRVAGPRFMGHGIDRGLGTHPEPTAN